MKKYFIVADCHSFYTIMKSTLDAAGWDDDNPDHILISLGDLFDRGDESVEMLNFISSLPEERKICIMGNHELLMEDMMCRGYGKSHDFSNGTTKTVCDVTGEQDVGVAIQMMRLNKEWAEYFHSCQYYVEIGNAIFTHGWIPANVKRDKWGYYLGLDGFDPNWRYASPYAWEEAVWENGMRAWNHGIREPGKTIFCGHWHTSWGHVALHKQGVEFPWEGDDPKLACFCPFIDEGIIAMDACTAVSGKVNCLVFTEEELNGYPLP